MKKITLLFLICFISVSLSCDNDDNSNEIEFKSTGKIIGPDVALCPCCGGFFIEIDNDTDRYRFNDLPLDSNIDLQNATFPASVKFNWSLDQNSLCSNYIIIEQIDLN